MGINQNRVSPSCVKPIKPPENICLSLSPIGVIIVSPLISPFSLLHWTCAVLNILVIFLPNVNFTLSFMIYINVPFPWYPTIIRSIESIDSFSLILQTVDGKAQSR